ncbi:YbcC family protein [Ferruginibacter sp.]|uniref:YbcC family protein n=1 Tax=Ferruginibacter sp. TaxID=1940288 RepID=UPI0019B9ED1C|nr:DUF2309 domain-containing protein [Ferruginibacter sp.]MBC7627465.1 DUF2309 domain-containing protein [Ferruginibacter sp.]
MENNTLIEIMRKACKKIAPVWPLENFVAVNPYFGYSDQKFETVAHYLASVAGIQTTLPVSFYQTKVKEGKIMLEDIETALAKKPTPIKNAKSLINELSKTVDVNQNAASVNTLLDVATQATKKDWNSFVISRVSAWAASYFDNGQASWVAANKEAGIFMSWKEEAEVDCTPEIAGLKNFRKIVKAMPDDWLQALQAALQILGLSQEELDTYFQRLLIRVGGWSAYAARLDWDSELYGGKDGKLMEFLAILACWEACFLKSIETPQLQANWMEAKKTKTPTGLNQQLTEKLILQDAFDIACQREIIAKFKMPKVVDTKSKVQLKAQAIFCIDVRSEVFRRNLELVDRGIETIGFAGFFAFPINFIPLAHETGEAQCPVLLKTGPTILEEIPDSEDNRKAYKSLLLRNETKQIWKSFKSGAVSCFSFVSPVGLSYLPKLFTDAFGLTRPVPHPTNSGFTASVLKQKTISLQVSTHQHHTAGIPLEQRIQMAKNALNAMSLTENFARFVLIVGHGSTTVNNPYATGLDCGACGGHTGEANAKVAAAVLNDKLVREKLKLENIEIPDKTVFLACLHDTTTDEISIYNEEEAARLHPEQLHDLKISMGRAGHATRTERALRMAVKSNVDSAIKARSKDWSQVRPEWGLAGCSSFVVAPRERTEHLDLGGQTFLHSYNWKKDQGFSILELIMTAPMVVTNWINMQYYASTVDNNHFGSGNKTLHNVTAGVGVLEGYSGDLRVGLPMQSVHDGEIYQHEPVKLNVIIEAPLQEMNAILKKHEHVRNLCNNGWLHLLAMDEQGTVAHRYVGEFNWEKI